MVCGPAIFYYSYAGVIETILTMLPTIPSVPFTTSMTTHQPLRTIKPADLPAPPQAAIAIMRACGRKDMNNEKLGRLAAKDPVLTAELLRVANSAMFGFSGKVQSVARAISLLGLRALRNLALCLSLRGALKDGAIPGFDITLYWEDALRHATCARMIGLRSGMDADECFTAGLLQEFGMLVLFFLQPDKGCLWSRLYARDPDSRQEMVRKHFGVTHGQVTMMLARKWSLPTDLAEALGNPTYPDGPPATPAGKLGLILVCGDWLATVFNAEDKHLVLERSKDLLARYFALDGDQVDQCLEEVPEQVGEAAEALGLHISQQNDFSRVICEANFQLTESNLSYQELTWQLEKALQERDQLAAELDQELTLAREMQQTLLPPPMDGDFPVSGINISARYLSGDFYDYFTLADGRIYFNLGDVSGKGANAALMMAKVSSLFRCIGKRVHDPGQLLAVINEEVCQTAARGMFITLVAGIYDPRTGALRLVNAGHPPLLLFSGDVHEPETIKAGAPPIGVVPDLTFPEVSLTLGNRSLYMYSDGVTEGHIGAGEVLGQGGLVRMITELSSLPPQERLAAIVDRFRSSSLPLRDDVTLLLLEDRHARL
jgi:sigma-B regulation protein RsbU (phosphoserine phosphatase)